VLVLGPRRTAKRDVDQFRVLSDAGSSELFGFSVFLVVTSLSCSEVNVRYGSLSLKFTFL
jgi:hypothetical protein